MRGNGTMCLHKLIFNSPYVIKRHLVASMMTLLKLIMIYNRAKWNSFP